MRILLPAFEGKLSFKISVVFSLVALQNHLKSLFQEEARRLKLEMVIHQVWSSGPGICIFTSWVWKLILY